MASYETSSIKERIHLARANTKPYTPGSEPTAPKTDRVENGSKGSAAESKPWEFLDRKLSTFNRFMERQQEMQAQLLMDIQEIQEIVHVQMLRQTASISPNFTQSVTVGTVGAESLSRYSSASRLDRMSNASTSKVSRRQDSGVLPVLNVYHHGNSSAFTAGLRPYMMRDVPPIRKGFSPWAKANMARIVDSPFFEPAMAIVIFANALNIGFAIDAELRGNSPTVHSTLEMCFIGIFAIELGLRAAVRGVRSLATPFAALDSFLIIVTVITEVVKPIVSVERGNNMGRVLDQVMLLRVARLLRLARSARLVACLESLWKLAQGLARCVGTMGSACVLMFITIYIFACFGAELIAKPHMDNPEVGSILRDNFSTMPQILLTLCQFVSMDSTAAIYYPLINHAPWLAIYFWLIVMIVPIALLNLITAILVEDVISTVQADEEMKQIHRRRQLKQLTPALKELFKRFDTSGDGRIQIREVAGAIRDGLVIPEPLQAFLDPARMLDLFDALDADNSGELSEAEFVDGLSYVSMTDVDIETIQMLHLLRCVRRDMVRQTGTAFRSSEAYTSAADGLGPVEEALEEPDVQSNPDSEGALAI